MTLSTRNNKCVHRNTNRDIFHIALSNLVDAWGHSSQHRRTLSSLKQPGRHRLPPQSRFSVSSAPGAVSSELSFKLISIEPAKRLVKKLAPSWEASPRGAMWTSQTELLTERWCDSDPKATQVLTRATQAAARAQEAVYPLHA